MKPTSFTMNKIAAAKEKHPARGAGPLPFLLSSGAHSTQHAKVHLHNADTDAAGCLHALVQVDFIVLTISIQISIAYLHFCMQIDKNSRNGADNMYFCM
jgi:hypothetical protein